MRRKRDRLKILYIVSLSILLGVVGIRPSQAENSWTSKTPMPTERLDSVSGVVNGKIYVIGGWIPPQGAKTNKVEVYDPVTDTWTEKTPMPDKGVHIACGVADGKIYVIGGQWSNNPMTAGFEYDPLFDIWTSIAPMPTARYGHDIGVVNGKIYVIGGVGSAGYKNEMYDPATNTWTIKAPMPTTYRDHLGVAVVNNKIYAIGGRHGYNSPPYDLNEEYDPYTNEWTTKKPMPTARAGFYELAVVDNKIYVMGGENGITNSVYSENEMYDPEFDEWTALKPLPTPRHGMSIQAVNNKIYTIGGGPLAYYDWSNINEEYTPISTLVNQPPDISAIPDSLSKNEGETITTSEIELATDPDGDPLTYTYSGWLSSLPYTTTYDDAGTHILHVDVSDGVNPPVGKDITITVNGGANQPPTADDQALSLQEDTSINISLTGSDPDGDSLTYTIVIQPEHGTLSGTAPNVTYKPNLNYDSTDSFTFKANDGISDSNIATISLAINPVNDAPELSVPDTIIFEVKSADPATKTYKLQATDPDGDTLTYSATGLPSGAILDPYTGELSWTITLSDIGSYPVTFTVSDGVLQDTKTITVTVTEATDFADGPDKTELKCYNNVFNPTKGEKALIVVELPKQAHVRLGLYNTRGNRIRELADEQKEAGTHKYYWDGKTDSGNVVGSGLYFVHIQAGDYKKTKKIVVVK